MALFGGKDSSSSRSSRHADRIRGSCGVSAGPPARAREAPRPRRPHRGDVPRRAWREDLPPRALRRGDRDRRPARRDRRAASRRRGHRRCSTCGAAVLVGSHFCRTVGGCSAEASSRASRTRSSSHLAASRRGDVPPERRRLPGREHLSALRSRARLGPALLRRVRPAPAVGDRRARSLAPGLDADLRLVPGRLGLARAPRRGVAAAGPAAAVTSATRR
jgi:hypothetical protein